MIEVVDPSATLFLFVVSTALAIVLFFRPLELTRLMGKIYFWFKSSARKGKTYKPAGLERIGQQIAERAINDPASITYYRFLWPFLGLIMLFFSLCSLAGLLTYLFQLIEH